MIQKIINLCKIKHLPKKRLLAIFFFVIIMIMRDLNFGAINILLIKFLILLLENMSKSFLVLIYILIKEKKLGKNFGDSARKKRRKRKKRKKKKKKKIVLSLQNLSHIIKEMEEELEKIVERLQPKTLINLVAAENSRKLHHL